MTPLLSLLLTLAPAAQAAPTVSLYTMGPGEHPFSRFGHAAMCVREAEEAPGEQASGRCYNYGTADFRTPLPLSWDFVRGRAMFWVSVQGEAAMIAAYQREDRDLFRQVLPLEPDAASGLAAALERSTAEDQRFYRYHHFQDNCTTRLRDLIDQHSGGALSRGADRPVDPSFRDFARRGFAGDLPLLLVTELALGRGSDRPITRWEAMFLPEVLREEVASRLSAAPDLVYARAAPLSVGSTRAGRELMLAVGPGLAGLSLVRPRISRAISGLMLGLLAAIVWSLALVSALPELRWNEVLLVLWPTDLLLPWLTGPRGRRLLDLRLLFLAGVSALAAAGVLSQPLLAPAAMALLPLVVLRGISRP